MSNRLNPIYTALDSHQYSKAAKLAAALPSTNVLGRALLAFAYYKNGQQQNALEVIEDLIGWKEDKDELDLAEFLDRKPSPKDWSKIPTKQCPPELADETTLETLAITLQGLRSAEILYKLYAWVGEHHPSIRLYALPKQYAAGLQVLVQSNHDNGILASMQALAIQMAKLSSNYTAWAARTALWQWQLAEESARDDVRVQILPRLAESLAKKVVEASGEIEDYMLWIEVLKSQSRWQDLSDILPTMERMPPMQVLELQLECCQKLEAWDMAQDTCIVMLRKHPGQWVYWKSLIQFSLQKGGFEEADRVTTELVEELQTSRPTRSISLVSCELSLVGLEQGAKSLDDLQRAIQNYAATFSSKASCIFSDLTVYLEKLLQVAGPNNLDGLYDWADEIRASSIQGKDEDNRDMLRSLIFALQVMHKLASETKHELPLWSEIATAWLSFPTTEGVQKENQPSDELILIAVDCLLGAESTINDLVTAATLLEMGLKKSSYNPYLKLRLIDVYQRLSASDRCWDLFRDMGVKHIQFDSCTFFALPALLEGGLYRQAVIIANETLKFHVATISDASDFISRALENGRWSKADEFLVFQRRRMNNSLSWLESKGITMDCAPLMLDRVGQNHGVVGGDEDAVRAEKLILEAHNATGAPSILSLKSVGPSAYSDNRDTSILPSGMSAPPKEEIYQAALRRQYYHGILVRCAIILDSTKAPKKGKLPKAPEALAKRCQSLLSFIPEDYLPNPWMRTVKMLALAIVVVSSGMPVVDDDSLKFREDRATELLKDASSFIDTTDSSYTAPVVGRLIADHIVSLLAMIRMTATVFALFGWGKRKKRDSVTALAELASKVELRLNEMSRICSELAQDVPIESPANEILEKTLWEDTLIRVNISRRATSERLMLVLEEFLEELKSFGQTE